MPLVRKTHVFNADKIDGRNSESRAQVLKHLQQVYQTDKQ